MSKSKDIGTRFESACRAYVRVATGCDCERSALHGSRDVGDLGGLASASGLRGVAECKAGAQAVAAQPANVAEWRRQTEVERANAGADFAWLLLKTKGAGEARMGRTRCDMTLRSLRLLADGGEPSPASAGVWVTLDLDTACWLLGGHE
ncbi:hypothetical protein [uncultured Parolsenella sp.]|uniref:hypothetical protein n=1 Tax=uncultured Parolsenella sp. TaxID=2083008 RepID=UPI0025F3DCD6|nr:hypothetical protein [uncultured Parolsenella sp.]